MFTGLVEAACPVVAALEQQEARRITLDLRRLASAPGARGQPVPGAPAAIPAPGAALAHVGDSVAVNGCCLTVAVLEGDRAGFDVVTETLSRTNLGALVPGALVNVERSLRYGDPIDGHLVSGHVERTGTVLRVARLPGEVRLTVRCGADFARRTLPKGSVAVDGVSLTVAELHAETFVVALVPHTLERTTLGRLAEGAAVNLEADLLGQWIRHAVSAQR